MIEPELFSIYPENFCAITRLGATPRRTTDFQDGLLAKKM